MHRLISLVCYCLLSKIKSSIVLYYLDCLCDKKNKKEADLHEERRLSYRCRISRETNFSKSIKKKQLINLDRSHL